MVILNDGMQINEEEKTNMASKFHADFIYGQNENDLIIVGFADKAFDPKNYILLQKSCACGEQGKRLGLDTVHITYGEQSHAAYGGIEKFILGKRSAEVFVAHDTAKTLSSDELIEVAFSPSNPKVQEIVPLLEILFKEMPGVFVNEVG